MSARSPGYREGFTVLEHGSDRGGSAVVGHGSDRGGSAVLGNLSIGTKGCTANKTIEA